MALTVAEAEVELATIKIAIGEYVGGTRRKRFKVMSAGVLREHEFSDSNNDTLFKYLTERRAELETFIASNSTDITTVANSFAKNKNIPLVFRRNG